ncbi:MAG: glycosyltransferase [Chloroflexota bacterium]|nr:glycosyltransferase [Chloroflexota bacterium]
MDLRRRRHVAFLSEHASPVALLGSVDSGGQNVYVDEVSRNVVPHGYEVDIFTRRNDPTEPRIIEWAPGVRIINIDFGPSGFLLKDDMWPHMPEFLDGIRRFMAEDDTTYDLLHGNFWMSGWVAARLGQELNVPVVQIFHAMGETKRRHQGDADTSPDGRIEVERGIVRDVDRLIAQCPAEERELIDDYDADPAKVVVIPSAVNIERYRPMAKADARAAIGINTNGLLIGYIGRILPRKDPRNIVRALAILTREHGIDARLMLVGGETREPDPEATPEIGELQKLATELGVLDRLIFTGKRQPDELHAYYRAVDVAVTTPWYEPFGLTPLEAMACGTPVIGSAVGGITFTIDDGETGLLVPPKDPSALANALAVILGNPERRERMGRAARERVEREFTWATVGQRTAALYDSLLDGRLDITDIDQPALAGHLST